MWSPFVFFLFVGFISASTPPAWKDNKEYVYKISGRTLASLDIANAFSGILMKATLRIQTTPEGKLQCLITNPQYAQIHSELSEGALTHIPNAEVNWKPLELSKKPFQVIMNRGIITDLVVNKNVPNWEANIIKGIISQFQMNINEGQTYYPTTEYRRDSALFKIIEATVSGNTETLYEINPIPDHLLLNSQFVPDFQKMEEDENETLEVLKHKNYTESVELPSYVYGLGNVYGRKAVHNVMGKFFVRSTVTRALVTGTLKQFTIQNSFTVNEIFVSPTLADKQRGSVVSMWNATLETVKSQDQIFEDVDEPVRLGGLVYSYGKSYSHSNKVYEKQKDHDASRYDKPAVQRPFSSGDLSNFDSENGYKQEQPQINKAAECPFLPYTIGNKGRSVKLDADVVKSVVSIAREIGDDLQDPIKSLQENTLAKFINMVKLVRVMDEEELKKAGRELFADSQDRSRYTAWAAYRDAVGESGSQPALLVIQTWIENRNIQRQEAAHVVSAMSNSVQEPTTQYLSIFFEMIRKPVVTSQWPLNETAILNFAELTRHVYFDDNYYKTQYPRKSFKKLREKQGLRFVKDIVIPYFSQLLDKAVLQDKPNKIHTYIRALGYIGYPTILKAFEPYLEGKKHCSQFQRGLMVTSLDKLVKTYPETARIVLFRIYENTGEHQAVRVAAVYQLMRAKPTIEMLQFMAAYTKVDTQEQVNAAVKTSIQHAADLKTNEFTELSYAANMAKPLLTETEYGLHQGGNYLRNYFVDEINRQYKETVQMYGSRDSFYPKGIKYALRTDDGGVRNQMVNVQALMTSVEQLGLVLEQQTKSYHQQKQQQEEKSEKQQQNPWSSQNIAHILDMKAEAREQLEGSIFMMDWNLPYKMLSFDNGTIEQLPKALEQFENKLNSDNQINFVKLINGGDVILAFPTEMGIPFVFTYDAPMFFKVEGKIKAAAHPKLSQDGKIQRPDSIRIKSDAVVTIGSKIQGHISFVTPFDHQQYYSGFDKTFQGHIPVVGTLDWNLKTSEVKIDVTAQERHKNAPLLHYSTWPYTSRRDIMDFRTLVSQKHSQYIKPDNIRSIDTVLGKKQTGLAYQIQMEHDRNTIKMSDMRVFCKKGFVDGFRNLWNDADIQYSQLNITYLPQKSSTKKVQLRFSYQQDYVQKGEGQSIDWEQVSQADKPSQRRGILSAAASADIKNVESLAADTSIRFQGEKNMEYILSGAYAKSNVDTKSRVFAFYKQDCDDDKPFEMKFESINDVPKANVLNLEDALSTEPEAHSAMALKFDSKNGEKGQVKADVKITRSDKRKEYLTHQPMYQQCKRDMRVGNNQSPACVNMTISSQYMDKVDMDIKFDNLSPAVEDAIEIVYAHLKYKYYPNLDVDRQQTSQSKNQIKVQALVDRDLKYINVSVNTNEQDTTFKDIELGEYTRRLLVVHPTYDAYSRLMSKVLEIDTINPVCVVDESQITTFDNLTYEASVSRHWTVIAQYVPKRANEINQVFSVEEQLKSQLRNLVVLVRENPESHKDIDVKIVTSSPETDFEVIEITIKPNQPTTSGAKGVIMVNNQQVEISDSQSREVKGGYIQIYALPNGEVKVEVQDIFYLIYDGRRVRLEATSDTLRGHTRGVCGVMDDQKNTETLTPQNCFALDSEKFIKSYEVEGEEGQQIRQEFSGDSDQCVEHNMPLYVNVIRPTDTQVSDKFDESKDNDCTRQQTRYLEHDREICFTTTTVPVCINLCQAQGYITKNISIHCIDKTNVALLWKMQIDNGGNPDFSHKKEHMKVQMEIPQSCSERVQ